MTLSFQWGSASKENGICFMGSKFFPLRVDPEGRVQTRRHKTKVISYAKWKKIGWFSFTIN